MIEYRQPIRATADTFTHYLYATPGHEPILMAFVNALLDYAGEPLVKEIQVKNPFNPKTFPTDKQSIIDIKALTTNDRQFVIEFQTSPYDSFIKRLEFNWAKTFSIQLNEGEHYRLLLPVMVIAVLNYLLFDRLSDLCNMFHITAKNDPSFVLSKDFLLFTLELVEKKIDRIRLLPRPLRDWAEFFWYADKKTEDEMNILLADCDPIIKLAYGKYTFFMQSEELRLVEESRQQYLHDRATEMEYATRTGIEKGMKKGMKKGIKKGMEKGMIVVARNLKDIGVDSETIAKATGLTVEEIDRLD
ncbi:MAG: Rpn family recombination-promoting nuclease/putative transposase [Planctomycetaceae bacterium]|jgi:predicted transposase/invertase (TIGR01784 family)|nr:Rpn family recombination-promoting nuclease/putative transposase [Planctomycetaceae bacterium]